MGIEIEAQTDSQVKNISARQEMKQQIKVLKKESASISLHLSSCCLTAYNKLSDNVS